MTPAELKNQVEYHGHSPFFFTRDTMRFFGDTMANYGVRAQPITIRTYTDEAVKVWVLYRKHPVKHGLDSDTYFNVDTFEREHEKKGE